MLKAIRDMINRKQSFNEAAQIIFEDAVDSALDDFILLEKEEPKEDETPKDDDEKVIASSDDGEDSGADDEEFDLDETPIDPSANTAPEGEEDDEITDPLDSPIDGEGELPADPAPVEDEPVGDDPMDAPMGGAGVELPNIAGRQTGEPVADNIDDILQTTIDLKTNTLTDVLPVPPANAGDAVIDDGEDPLDMRIDSGFGDEPPAAAPTAAPVLDDDPMDASMGGIGEEGEDPLDAPMGSDDPMETPIGEAAKKDDLTKSVDTGDLKGEHGKKVAADQAASNKRINEGAEITIINAYDLYIEALDELDGFLIEGEGTFTEGAFDVSFINKLKIKIALAWDRFIEMVLSAVIKLRRKLQGGDPNKSVTIKSWYTLKEIEEFLFTINPINIFNSEKDIDDLLDRLQRPQGDDLENRKEITVTLKELHDLEDALRSIQKATKGANKLEDVIRKSFGGERKPSEEVTKWRKAVSRVQKILMNVINELQKDVIGAKTEAAEIAWLNEGISLGGGDAAPADPVAPAESPEDPGDPPPDEAMGKENDVTSAVRDKVEEGEGAPEEGLELEGDPLDGDIGGGDKSGNEIVQDHLDKLNKQILDTKEIVKQYL